MVQDVSNSMSPAFSENVRLQALDVFRGATILGMILVNNPGDWGHLYWPLDHAEWHGWTPTDLIFPFFLFIVGTALSYSLRKYRTGTEISPAVYWRIARRTLVLIGLGLLLNRSTALFSYLLGYADTIDLSNWRFPGVLQRIGLAYCVASLIVLHCGVRLQAAIATVILLGYWAALAWFPSADYQANLSPSGNLVRVVDLAVFDVSHLYTQGTIEKTDPEGLLSTFPAIVTVLFGYWAGLVVQRKGIAWHTVGRLAAVGLALVAAGIVWGWYFPISKKLWTSSFVILTAGWAYVSFAASLMMFDLWGWRRLGRAFEIVGVNAILVFVLSGLLAVFLRVVVISGQTAKAWIFQSLFTSWIDSPELASLGFAVMTVAFWWVMMWLLSLRGWTIRV